MICSMLDLRFTWDGNQQMAVKNTDNEILRFLCKSYLLFEKVMFNLCTLYFVNFMCVLLAALTGQTGNSPRYFNSLYVVVLVCLS